MRSSRPSRALVRHRSFRRCTATATLPSGSQLPSSLALPTVTDIAIVGAGYVGLPLAQVFATAGRSVVLVDVDRSVVGGINRGESHIEDVPSEVLGPLVEQGLVSATTDYDALRGVDSILVALATPLTKQREPD